MESALTLVEISTENVPQPADIPTKKTLGTGFMDSDDDDDDHAPSRRVAWKNSPKKSLFIESEEEEETSKKISAQAAADTERISRAILEDSDEEDVVDVGKVALAKALSKNGIWSDSEEDEDFVSKPSKVEVEDELNVTKSSTKASVNEDDVVDDFAEELVEEFSEDKVGKPRKERLSKKRAMEEMEDLQKESQRLVRGNLCIVRLID